jgi:integrase
MRQLNKLSASFVKNAPAGKHPDGGGLYFVKMPSGSGQWVYRYSIGGKRHEMGLGGYPTITLARARVERGKWAEIRAGGEDPLKARDKQTRDSRRGTQTFAQVAEQTFEARKAQLRGAGKAGQWMSPLILHVMPKLGNIPIDGITQTDIVSAIRPIWHSKAATAKKAIDRTGIVLKYGAALGLSVDLNATAAAKALMGEQNHKSKNIPALYWRDVPEFYSSLSDGSPTQLALRLLILTGARSKGVRFCHVDQIDGDVWTIPEGLVKGREGKTEPFRVPLSAEAHSVISEAADQSRDGFLFPSPRRGVISDMAMSALMRRRAIPERPHGFRSSLRTWMSEATEASFEIKETVMGHAVGSKVIRAYDRTDHLERRALLMERWANHCTNKRS